MKPLVRLLMISFFREYENCHELNGPLWQGLGHAMTAVDCLKPGNGSNVSRFQPEHFLILNRLCLFFLGISGW